MYFTLPHVHINSLYTSNVVEINQSLNEYIQAITIESECQNVLNTIGEIISFFKLSLDKCLYVGPPQLNYFSHQQVPHDEIPQDSYSCILCMESFNIKHQSLGGNCIIRMKKTYDPLTIQMLYYLAACYETVHIYKPEMETISDKYIVCCKLRNVFEMNTFQIPYYFLTKLDDMNAIFGHYQLEYICSKINHSFRSKSIV